MNKGHDPKFLFSHLLNHQRIAIFSHIRPDGDCLGAQFGLADWLRSLGKVVYCFNEDPIPAYLCFLSDYTESSLLPSDAYHKHQIDALLVVDGNKAERFGQIFEQILSQNTLPLYCLDHHPDVPDIYDAQYTRTDMSSSCEMVYHLIECHPEGASKLTKGAAKCLYTGITTDTGSHAFDSVSAQTLRASAHLMEIGQFRPNEIHEKLYSSRKMNEIRLLGLALNTLQTHFDGQIATIEVRKDFYEQTQTLPEDTEGIVNYALSIEGVKAAIFFKEVEEDIKMSLRSKSDLDVNAWGKQLNGGGHKKAAGAKLQGSLEEVKAKALAIGHQMLLAL